MTFLFYDQRVYANVLRICLMRITKHQASLHTNVCLKIQNEISERKNKLMAAEKCASDNRFSPHWANLLLVVVKAVLVTSRYEGDWRCDWGLHRQAPIGDQKSVFINDKLLTANIVICEFWLRAGGCASEIIFALVFERLVRTVREQKLFKVRWTWIGMVILNNY